MPHEQVSPNKRMNLCCAIAAFTLSTVSVRLRRHVPTRPQTRPSMRLLSLGAFVRFALWASLRLCKLVPHDFVVKWQVCARRWLNSEGHRVLPRHGQRPFPRSLAILRLPSASGDNFQHRKVRYSRRGLPPHQSDAFATASRRQFCG